MKSPLASTTPPRATKRRLPLRRLAIDADDAAGVAASSATARVEQTMSTPARRAARPRWTMNERELGSTLCMRGFLCGGSGIGP